MLQEGLKKLTIFLTNVLEVESSSFLRDSLGHLRTDITMSQRQDCGSWFNTTWPSVEKYEVPYIVNSMYERLVQCFGSGYNHVTESGSVLGIRIRIQEGKNYPLKK
jgi:hypothetical protein